MRDEELADFLVEDGERQEADYRRGREKQPSAADRASKGLVVQSLAQVKPEPVRWLWPGYLPLGKLASLEGPPGQGKSTLTLEIAARLSTGRPMPDGATSECKGPVRSLFLSYEDDAADTIKPRLLAAGGDDALVGIIKGVVEPSGFGRTMQLVADLPHVDEYLASNPDVRLLVVDPLSAAIAAGNNMDKDQDMRTALAPIADFASQRGICVLVVRHPKKSPGRSALLAGGGSVGIIAAVRQALYLDVHPEISSQIVLAVSKSNLGPTAPSLCFRKESATIEAGGQSIPTSRLTYVGVEKIDADQLLAARNGPIGDAPTAAQQYLRDLLSAGAQPRKQVLELAETAGFRSRSIDRAARELGVTRQQSGFGEARTSLWSIPAIPATSPRVANMATMAEMEDLGSLEDDAA